MRFLILVLVACATTHRPGRVVVTDSDVEILEGVTFAGDTAELAPADHKMLDVVAATLAGNPSITLVEVRAVTAGNPALAERRALAVVDYLVTHDVPAARLRAASSGEGDRTAVNFEIIERDGSTVTPCASGLPRWLCPSPPPPPRGQSSPSIR